MESFWVGIDIGGTNLRMGAVEPSGNMKRHQVLSSRVFLSMSDPVAALQNAVEGFLREIGAPPAGVCIGFPGVISKDRSTVLSCPNLPVFDNTNIRAALEASLGVPVVVAHDVLLLLANDLREHNLYQADCVMAVYVGTGLGNAMYIHGRMLEGANGVAGELGHIPVPRATWPCACGNTGCIEPIASGKRLEAIRHERFPDSASFDEVFAHGEGDPLCADYLDSIACAVATEINILDPDCIILGGGVLSVASFPYERLLERIRAHTRKPFPAQALRFVRASADPLQGVRGAGIFGRRCLEASHMSCTDI